MDTFSLKHFCKSVTDDALYKPKHVARSFVINFLSDYTIDLIDGLFFIQYLPPWIARKSVNILFKNIICRAVTLSVLQTRQVYIAFTGVPFPLRIATL